MSGPPEKSTRSLGHVVVTGGAGFLGHHIVTLLNKRNACTKLTVLDLKPAPEPVPGVEYSFGDITDYDSMLALFQKIKPDAVIHTASPNANMHVKELMYKVNVGGTKNILRVSQESGVKAFVYTSSASIIHDTRSDLILADESYPIIIGKDQPQYYTTTKAEAEIAVLAANRETAYPNFLTAAIRPSAMFGTGDVQLLPPLMASYYRGQAKFQLGDNNNLFDYTEITNVAHAHHLATAALMATGERYASGMGAPLDHERVDGEAFLITNDCPVYFFDFARRCWAEMGDNTAPKSAWTLSKDVALLIASLLGWIFWLLRKGEPTLTNQRVTYATIARYFSIDKAKRRLGYRPIVGLEEGIRKGVRDALYRGAIPGQPMEFKGNAEILKLGVPGAKVKAS